MFTDLVRDAQGRATMRLMYNGKEVQEILGPKFKTVLMWSTPLAAPNAAAAGGAAGGGGRAGGGGGGRGAAPGAPVQTVFEPVVVDPAQGVRVAPPPTTGAGGGANSTAKGFIAFEPMVAITDALNLAQKGVYKDLQSIPPGGSWEESFWVTAKGF